MIGLCGAVLQTRNHRQPTVSAGEIMISGSGTNARLVDLVAAVDLVSAKAPTFPGRSDRRAPGSTLG